MNINRKNILSYVVDEKRATFSVSFARKVFVLR